VFAKVRYSNDLDYYSIIDKCYNLTYLNFIGS